MRMLTINAISYAVQGQSANAGQSCGVVRLTACDLRCSWSRTAYAFQQGSKPDLEAVWREVHAFRVPLVEVTGGEPLLQEDVYPLMQGLIDRGKTVLLE